METIQPIKRIVIIDALRGFALAGVAIAHILEQYVAGPNPEGFMEGVDSMPDNILQGIMFVLIRGKFFALFSILFGLSFAIQMQSAERKNEDFSKRFLWRAVLLFAIGYVHQLFYRGDILTIYAILAPFIIPFYKMNNKWILLVAGLLFLSIPRFLTYALIGNNSLFGLENGMQTAADNAYFEVLQSGSLLELFSQNAVYGMKTKMNFQLSIFARFYYTFGYFLLGLWIGKMGIFSKIEEKLPFIKKTLYWSLGLMLVCFGITAATFATAPQPMDFSHWQHVLGINFFDWFNTVMTIVIICAFMLLYRKNWWQKRLSFFAPYGRMALTNYILQTLIGTFVLFNWGLGYLGQIRSLYLFLIGIILITLQTWFSKWWLNRFKFGPLEWLWRSGTYLKWQQFKK